MNFRFLGPRLKGRQLQMRRYFFLLRTFRNGLEMLRRWRAGQPLERAVLWDGSTIRHPAGRGGLLEAFIGIWHDGEYTSGFYEPRAGDVVVDAGANVGLFSIWMARRCRESRIIALEPFKENYGFLTQNISACRLHQVVAMNAALGGHSGAGIMRNVGGRSLDHQLQTSSEETAESVPVLSLADILKQAGVETIAMCKIDIEGSEFDVFSEADSALFSRVQRFGIEYHDNIRPGTLNLLKTKLEPTHSVRIQPAGSIGCGMIYAQRRARK